MKTTGIVLFVFATLNFVVGLFAASEHHSAATSKFNAAILLLVLGIVFYTIGKSRERKRLEEKRREEQTNADLERRNKALENQKKYEEELQKKKQQEEKEEQVRLERVIETDSKRYKILNFYLDCSHWHKQEEELKICPLALPVEIVDVDEDEDTRALYNVCSLPKLILVDYNGKELKRWKGITSGSEINEFLYKNGYADKPTIFNTTEKNNKSLQDDDVDDYPKPISVITAEDLKVLMQEEYRSKVLCFAAEGGTKDQTQVKMEILLGKREKTAAMLAIEQPIREFLHKIFDDAGKEAFETSDNSLLRKMAVATNMMSVYKALNDEDGELHESKQKMTEIANLYGVSFNLIEEEEKENATKKYSK